VQSWEDKTLDLLRPKYPHWDIWFVICYIGPTAWCAKPKGAPVATINASSPEELVEEIASARLLP